MAQQLELLVEHYRKQALQITSMQLGYADPQSALRVCGVQLAPPAVQDRSPRLWANVPGSMIADFATLKKEHAAATALNAVWYRWMQSHEPAGRTDPKRILLMPQPDGEACRLHPLEDTDVLYQPNPRTPLPSVTTGRSSLAAKAHAFCKGQRSYDAGLTVGIPLAHAKALETSEAPWSQETLQRHGAQLFEHVYGIRKDIERITSLRVLQVDESTRAKILGVTVVTPQVRLASPILWPLYPQTTTEIFHAEASYAQRVLDEWRMTRAKPGVPSRIIAIPRPEDGAHMHPLAEDDILIPLK